MSIRSDEINRGEQAAATGHWVVTRERVGPSTSNWERKLASGEWEPFAVTGTSDYGEMWFRKWVPDATAHAALRTVIRS